MTSSKAATIKRLISLGLSAEDAIAAVENDSKESPAIIETPVTQVTPDPVPSQETKNDNNNWSVGNYQFGLVSVTLLEKKDDSHFRALVYPKGMRADHSIQPSKLSVQLLDAMKKSFSGIVDNDTTTDAKPTISKISKADKAQQALDEYIGEDKIPNIAYVGWRNKGVNNAFVWQKDGSGYLLHRIGFSGETYLLKGKQPVSLAHPGGWASRNDGRYTIKEYTK